MKGLFRQAKISCPTTEHKIFFKFFVKTGCVSTSQFQISEGINFFEIRGCIWPFSVGISEGTFFGKQNKAPATEKIFSHFFCEIGCHLAL